jgi:hypothetical protein
MLARDFGEIGVLAIGGRDRLPLDRLKLVLARKRATLCVDSTRLGAEASDQRHHANETED